MTEWKVIHDDVLSWCKTSDYMAHAIICDPPFHLTGGFMGAYWDRDGPDAISFQPKTWRMLAEHLLPGGFLFVFASSRGWHRLACALEDSGLIIQPSIFNWRTREVVEVPFCMIHLQGQSFPKASNISKQIDAHGGQSIGWFGPWLRKWRKKRRITQKELAKHFPSKSGGLTGCIANWELGYNLPTIEQFNRLVEVLNLPFETIEEAEREVVGIGISGKTAIWNEDGNMGDYDITAPATDLARAWEGHRYGGQILKDAAGPVIIAMKKPDTKLGPVIVAQKPWVGKRLDCIVETGAGSLNIEAARIGTNETITTHSRGTNQAFPKRPGETTVEESGRKKRQDLIEANPRQGRWPSNFVLCHVPPDANGEGGCRRVMVEEPCPVCSGRGIVEAKPIAETWEEWYAKTKDHGGTREEYDRLASLVGSAFCKECKGRGVVERVGVKRVKGTGMHGGAPGGFNPTGETLYGKGNPEVDVSGGHADPDGLETVDDFQCSKNCPARKLDEQAGERKSGALTRSETARAEAGKHGIYERFNGKPDGKHFPASKGGASRFFLNADWSHEIAERLAGADPVHYCPKSAKRERAKGLDDFYWRKDKAASIGFVRISQDEWEALGQEEERIHEETGKRVSLRAKGNIHSTVKPISLLVWLCRLLSPPKEYAPRRILIPFSGTLSEGIGAMLAGWEEIVAIDSERDYCDIGDARMKFWHAKMEETGLAEPKAILKACSKKSAKKQGSSKRSPDDAQIPLDLDSV